MYEVKQNNKKTSRRIDNSKISKKNNGDPHNIIFQTQRKKTIQRLIISNLDSLTEVSGFDKKLKSKLDDLSHIVLAWDDTECEKEVEIKYFIVKDGGITPAYTGIDGDDKEITINVYIEKWFLETADMGSIVGLISHELGVHHLTSTLMNSDEKKQEQEQQSSVSKDIQINGTTYSLPPTDCWNDGKGPNGSQKDHIEMAKPGSKRGEFYLDIVQKAILRTISFFESVKPNESVKSNGDLIQSIALQILTYAFDKAISIVIQDQRRNIWRALMRGQDIKNVTLYYIDEFPTDFVSEECVEIIERSKEVAKNKDIINWIAGIVKNGVEHEDGPKTMQAKIMKMLFYLLSSDNEVQGTQSLEIPPFKGMLHV